MTAKHSYGRWIAAPAIVGALTAGAVVAPHLTAGSSGSYGGGNGSSGSSGSLDVYLPVSTPAGMGALQVAMTQIGKPYKWGATGPNAWDCSGLIQWAFRSVGVNLPRVSQAQAKVGKAIPIAALAPGDVIIFYRNAGHIGIYAGGGQVFHAGGPNGRPIKFQALNTMPPIKSIRRYG
ncbi:MAG: NlpC/P60 family protein [Gordonia sp. (in: high G+C Gram-positive bacteria)]|uniref:NlpC/P60 family protein n=1 Tax=Gordonia sp. (in: high G+C Gram-positive bacteria) TaxID=84139 RepID=UPI0039E521D5